MRGARPPACSGVQSLRPWPAPGSSCGAGVVGEVTAGRRGHDGRVPPDPCRRRDPRPGSHLVLGVGGRDRARRGVSSRTDGTAPDQRKEEARADDRHDQQSGLVHDGSASCHSASLIRRACRAGLRGVGRAGHQPRSGDRGATVLGPTHDRRGQPVLGADGEGSDDHEQPTSERGLGPGHPPSMDPHSRMPDESAVCDPAAMGSGEEGELDDRWWLS